MLERPYSDVRYIVAIYV